MTSVTSVFVLWIHWLWDLLIVVLLSCCFQDVESKSWYNRGRAGVTQRAPTEEKIRMLLNRCGQNPAHSSGPSVHHNYLSYSNQSFWHTNVYIFPFTFSYFIISTKALTRKLNDWFKGQCKIKNVLCFAKHILFTAEAICTHPTHSCIYYTAGMGFL